MGVVFPLSAYTAQKWGDHGHVVSYVPGNWFQGYDADEVPNPEITSYLARPGVYGMHHHDGWLPVPSPSGKGWLWAAGIEGEINRYFRYSLEDQSTIQGAQGAWSGLNGAPKWLAVTDDSGVDILALSRMHPDVIMVKPGWYSGGQWPSSHGGDGTDQKWSVIVRGGATLESPPEPYHGSLTGVWVIGGLALAAVGGAALSGLGAAGGTAGAGVVEAGASSSVVAVSSAAEAVAGGVTIGTVETIGGVAAGGAGLLSQAGDLLSSFGGSLLKAAPGELLKSGGDLSKLGAGLLQSGIGGLGKGGGMDEFNFGFGGGDFDLQDFLHDVIHGGETVGTLLQGGKAPPPAGQPASVMNPPPAAGAAGGAKDNTMLFVIAAIALVFLLKK